MLSQKETSFFTFFVLIELELISFSYVFVFTFPLNIFRSSPSDVFLGKAVLKICSKFIGEHPRQSAISLLKSHFGIGVSM